MTHLPGVWSQAWKANEAYFIALAFYVCVCVIVSSSLGLNIVLDIYGEAFVLFGSATGFLLFTAISLQTMREKPERLLAALYQKIFGKYRLNERLIIGLPVGLSLPILLSIFTSMKSNISRMVPFYADGILIKIDEVIFGMDAWRFFQPVFGFPVATLVLNFFYNLWFIAMSVMFFLVAFSLEDAARSRARFLLCFLLLWAVLGNLFATFFASVGPVYTDYFFADQRFAPLVAYLTEANQSVTVWVLETQAYLLARSSADGPMIGSGISAFPSMHVAIAALYVVYCWSRGPVPRYLSLGFLGLVFIGSIQLGWHYAVDGAFSIAAVLCFWPVSGWLIARTRPPFGLFRPSMSYLRGESGERSRPITTAGV
jgi:hypothetical protein